MKKRKSLNLTENKAYSKIDDLITELKSKYGTEIEMDGRLINGFGELHDYVDDDLAIKIGYSPRVNVKFLYNVVNDYDFVNAVRALFHEEQHLIQLCEDYQDINPSEETIAMATRKLATMNNPDYYMSTYTMDMTEIDAESTAILKTYNYLKEEFPKADANGLICDLVNDKAQMNYFIKGHYNSVDKIMDAFSDKFEVIKDMKVNQHIYCIPFPSYDINEMKDESYRYLQACVREDASNQDLMDEFNSKSMFEDYDLLFASITCHLHPEIEYDKLYPCLSYVELSPENVWNRSLPSNLRELHVEHIPKEDIDYHLEAIQSVRKKSSKMKRRIV